MGFYVFIDKKKTGFIQARLCKIQGLLKDIPTASRTENLRKY